MVKKSKPIPKVAIIMGSDSDLPVMKEAATALQEFDIAYEISVVSAHRTPKEMSCFAEGARKRGIRVIIAGAGGAAHLPGMVAAQTELPVIGVPVPIGHMQGQDALLSIVQMPKGVPVATVAIGNAFNAGVLAAQILGAGGETPDSSILNRLSKYKEKLRKMVLSKKISGMIVVAWFGFSHLALSPKSEAKMNVVTTLPSFADIVAQVGGSDVSVVSLLKGTQDPHFAEVKPDLILKLNLANLLIQAGLDLEDGWLPPLLSASNNAEVQIRAKGYLDASTLFSVKDVSSERVNQGIGDVHPSGNPHFMLDPRNGLIFAQEVSDKLSKLEPKKAGDFKKRANDYIDDLKKHIQSWELALKPVSGKSVVTYHKSWTYFSSWIGFKEEEYIEPKPGFPPSPEHIVKLIEKMKEKKIQLILMEPHYPKETAAHIAKATGAKLLILPTEVYGSLEAKTYIALFDQIVQKLKTIESIPQ